MWAVWTGSVWVEMDEANVPAYRANGYECRFIPIKLPEYTSDPTVFPPYVAEGIEAAERYLEAL